MIGKDLLVMIVGNRRTKPIHFRHVQIWGCDCQFGYRSDPGQHLLGFGFLGKVAEKKKCLLDLLKQIY